MAIGKAILLIRHDLGLTQAQVGQRAGITVSYLSRLENGHLEPNMGTLQRLAKALEVPVSEIFAVIEEPREGQVHRCPVSGSGECIGEQLRSGRGQRPGGARSDYGPEELRLLRMVDYIALHGTREVREALAVLLEGLVQRAKRGQPPEA